MIKRVLWAALFAALFLPVAASAGSYSVVGSGGGTCASGTFSGGTDGAGNLTVQGGESVTINFTVNEPTYPAGWNISSSKWSTINVKSTDVGGKNVSFTAPSSGSFDFTGSWPGGCTKATATVTVIAAAPPPPPPPPPPPAVTPPPPPAATTSTDSNSNDSSVSDNTPDQSTTGAPSLDDNASQKSVAKSGGGSNNTLVAGIAGGGALVLIGALVIFLYIIRPKLRAKKLQAQPTARVVSIPPSQTAPTQSSPTVPKPPQDPPA